MNGDYISLPSNDCEQKLFDKDLIMILKTTMKMAGKKGQDRDVPGKHQ